MKSTLFSFTLRVSLLIFTMASHSFAQLQKAPLAGLPGSFTENKGQVCDQDFKARKDILFSGYAQGMAYHLKNNGISYQLSRTEAPKESVDYKPAPSQVRKEADLYSIYRVDINWLSANTKAVLKKNGLRPGSSNYYLRQCPAGALDVKTYGEIIYQNIYPGIDLKWYEKGGQLKYDYLVAAGVDYHCIQIEIKGAESISLGANGDLVLKTPLGEITEQAPLVIQDKKILPSKWIVSNNIVSYKIENLNPDKAFVIDPGVRVWGTYFGGTGSEVSRSCTTNTLGDVFIAGETNGAGTSIATSGAYQTSTAGGYDAFLAKFNTAGTLQWATYYGGAGFDQAYSCATNILGDVFLLGVTASTAGISSPGTQQNVYGGGTQDVFLAKFNNSGVRQWGTYYGDDGAEWAYTCATNTVGDVFIGGSVSSSTGTALASPGCHQPANGGGISEGFIAKFNSTGIRQWGTYYGGSVNEEVNAVCTTTNGDLFVTGYTSSTVSAVIATPGAYQTAHAGASYDAFLAKFDGNGVRLWGTFYGGNGNDQGKTCALDASGNIFLGGTTQTTGGSGIATAGAFQTTNGGGNFDAFLVKFNPLGVRQWGTYYGGPGAEIVSTCAAKSNGDVFLFGTTNNTLTSLITPGAWQTTYGGNSDMFLIGFNSSGVRQWSTYYGGSESEDGMGMSIDLQDNIYISGSSYTFSGTAVASPGSYQPAFGGGVTDAIVVKFEECTSPPTPTPGTSQAICSGNTATVSASTSMGSIQWFASANFTASAIASGNSYVTGTLSAGVYTLYAGAFTCGASQTRAAVTVSVFSSPVISTNSGTICPGKSFTIVPSGASTYSYSGGSAVVSPAASTFYTVTGTSSLGCGASNTATSYVTVSTNPTITVNSGTICSGANFLIIPSGAANYTYSGGSALVTPAITTTYAVSGTSSVGCVAANTAIATVSVLALPLVTVSGTNTFVCSNSQQTVALNAQGANSYTWNYGIAASSITVSPTATTNYTVTGRDLNGCSRSATFLLLVQPLPIITVSASNTLLCAGSQETVTLDAQGGTTYTWSQGTTGNIISVSPTATTIYTVTGSDALGCSKSAVFSLVVDPCTGVPELTSGTLRFYPNPVYDNMMVDNYKGALQITDATGRIVIEKNTFTETAVINLSGLAPGIYFLRAGNVSYKVIKL